MNYQLKGLILNCTLKSYTIAPIEALMCLKSLWSSMGVRGTRAPARGGGTSSGRRSSWPNSGVILSWCQFPSLSLADSLPLSPWVHQSMPPSPLPSSCRQRRWWRKWRGCIVGTTDLPRRQKKAETERDRMCNWVLDLKDQKSGVEGAKWHLEQELKRKKDELAQLEARKRDRGFWSE